jgi:hypothetical protein
MLKKWRNACSSTSSSSAATSLVRVTNWKIMASFLLKLSGQDYLVASFDLAHEGAGA